jgi:hypothetical protein
MPPVKDSIAHEGLHDPTKDYTLKWTKTEIMVKRRV